MKTLIWRNLCKKLWGENYQIKLPHCDIVKVSFFCDFHTLLSDNRIFYVKLNFVMRFPELFVKSFDWLPFNNTNSIFLLFINIKSTLTHSWILRCKVAAKMDELSTRSNFIVSKNIDIQFEDFFRMKDFYQGFCNPTSD